MKAIDRTNHRALDSVESSAIIRTRLCPSLVARQEFQRLFQIERALHAPKLDLHINVGIVDDAGQCRGSVREEVSFKGRLFS